jgi:hypothetical protein
MTSRSMERSRISLPRAGFAALLAGTLVTGALLGAAAYGGISATGKAAADAAIVAPVPHEPAFIRDARIEVGNGPLVGDTRRIPAESNNRQDATQTPSESARHARGHGPLE